MRSIIDDLEESTEARKQANQTVQYILVNNYLWIILFILQSSQHREDRDYQLRGPWDGGPNWCHELYCNNRDTILLRTGGFHLRSGT